MIKIPKLILGDADSELAYQKASQAAQADVLAVKVAKALRDALGPHACEMRESYAIELRRGGYFIAIPTTIDGQHCTVSVSIPPGAMGGTKE